MPEIGKIEMRSHDGENGPRHFIDNRWLYLLATLAWLLFISANLVMYSPISPNYYGSRPNEYFMKTGGVLWTLGSIFAALAAGAAIWRIIGKAKIRLPIIVLVCVSPILIINLLAIIIAMTVGV